MEQLFEIFRFFQKIQSFYISISHINLYGETLFSKYRDFMGKL